MSLVFNEDSPLVAKKYLHRNIQASGCTIYQLQTGKTEALNTAATDTLVPNVALVTDETDGLGQRDDRL